LCGSLCSEAFTRENKSTAETLPGTMKLHQLIFEGNNAMTNVRVRDLPCLCFACVNKDYDECINKEWVEAPRCVALVPSTSTTVTSRAAAASAGLDIAAWLDPTEDTKRLAVVPTEEEGYDFYLFCVSAPVSTLLVDTDNGYGDVYEKGSVVIKGWGRISVPFSAQPEPFVTRNLT
jgi:hypothetical protein